MRAHDFLDGTLKGFSPDSLSAMTGAFDQAWALLEGGTKTLPNARPPDCGLPVPSLTCRRGPALKSMTCGAWPWTCTSSLNATGTDTGLARIASGIDAWSVQRTPNAHVCDRLAGCQVFFQPTTGTLSSLSYLTGRGAHVGTTSSCKSLRAISSGDTASS